MLPPELWARAEPDAAAVLYKQAVARSAEQSSAEQGVVARLPSAEPPDEPHSSEALRAARKQSSTAQREQAALLLRPEVVPAPQDGQAELPRLEQRKALQVQRVSQPQAQQSRVA